MSDPAAQPAVVFDRVSRTFGNLTALDDVSFSVPQGSIFGVVGTSGAGKSTLIRTVNGQESVTSGEVTTLGVNPHDLAGAKLRALRQDVGMIFQSHNLLTSKTVADNVGLPLVLSHTPKAEIAARVDEALARVGLADRAGAKPRTLSGGQRQRVGIARALVTNPRLLLCDEPTSALDPMTTAQILQLLTRINEELGITILLITHQMNVVAKIADHVAVLEHGKLLESGPVEDVFSNPQHELTRQFVATAAPVADARVDADTVIRVSYRDGGARTLLHDVESYGVRASLLQANELPLRRTTIGSLVIGLDGPGAADAIRAVDANPNLTVEVIR